MRTLKSVSLLIVLVLAQAAVANAQTCLGLPSFNSGSVHVNVAGQFPDSASGYAVGIGAGRPNNLFANIGGGQFSQDGIEAKQNYGFLEFGYQFPISRLNRAQVCPIAGGSYGQGPDDEVAGDKVTSSSASVGVAAGMAFGSSRFSAIPNLGLRYEFGSFKVDNDDESLSYDQGFSSGIVELGLAFLFLERFSIQPLVQIPFAEDTGDPVADDRKLADKISFGLFASFAFGWRAQ
jgi:hypothetical protein